MLTVHHLGISQSDRIVWLCEELEIPYEFIRYERDPVTRMAPANYKALHPFGTAPVITDGEMVLGESGAIIDYICNRYGGGRLVLSADHPDYAEYLFWYHFANASLMPAALIDFVLNSLGDVVQPGTMALLRERGDTAHAMMEAHLAKNTWFAGDEFSAADVIMVFPLTTMRMFAPRDLAPYPNILAYLQRVGARPAFQRAMAKADPDLPPMLT